MSILQFVWAGDLDENKSQRLQNPQALFQERCHPMTMIVKQDKKETRIGRKNSKMPPDYALESAVSNRMISRNHVTIERLIKGNYMLYDHSLNGTYVNYCRVIGGTILKNEDIVCFGHINGANIKPGESVTPFSTDLKYRVKIIERYSERSDSRCELMSASSDEDTAVKVHESRKRIKLAKPASDQSDRSSDSSFVSSGNNYVKRKKSRRSSGSSSDQDRQIKTHKDRHNKSKKHTSAVMVGGRHAPGTEPPKLNYSRKIHEQKQRKMHEKLHSKNKHSDRKFSTKRVITSGGSNIKSNYDYEECRAHPCRRPDGENPIDWIMCDKCNQWFHQFCVGLDEALEDDESYYCPYCTHN